MKRVFMVLALVLVMAASAAPGALAGQGTPRQNGYCYQHDSELGAYHCLPSKKTCEQARANDPMALSECIKQNKIFR